jgi:signal transduction histidine kinase
VASLAESLRLPTPSLTVAASGTMAVCEGFLEPVLRELFENASRFHPSGSPAIEVTLSPDASAGMWTLRITDDGIWLPEDKLERLGTPFYQVEEGFTGEMTGSGLGLAGLVHGVRRIGGEVSFANRPDRPGFQVALRFRVAEAGDEPASEPATDAVDGTDEASARRAGPP